MVASPVGGPRNEPRLCQQHFSRDGAASAKEYRLQPWCLTDRVIPSPRTAEFAEEPIHDLSRRVYGAEFPMVRIDDARQPDPPAPRPQAREKYECQPHGTCGEYMVAELPAGWHLTNMTRRRTRAEGAHFLQDIAAQYLGATRTRAIMDSLNMHRSGALRDSFEPTAAQDRFKFVCTPTHGSWLNVAESAIDVRIRQCLDRRTISLNSLRKEFADWQTTRARIRIIVDSQFTTDDARLTRLYPTSRLCHNPR